jgi:hypothetical protein
MNYIRTSSGGMMAIMPRTNAVATDKKKDATVKVSRKSKKDAANTLK